MKISQRKNVVGSIKLLFLAALGLLLALIAFVVWQWQPERMVMKRQQAFYQGVEKRSPARIRRLVADHYADDWAYTADDLVEATLDAVSQFLSLMVTAETSSIEKSGEHYRVTAHLTLSGKSLGPVGGEVLRVVNSVKTPFVFVWEKQSIAPASWKLIKVENSDLPVGRYQHLYRPGDLRRAMKGE